MAKGKDPAFLFYPNDWTGGTALLTRHQKGCYIDILIQQFHKGSLTLNEIRTILGADYGKVWPTLLDKFKVDEAGKYFNVKLKTEMEKRAEYSKKQSDRVKKRWDEYHGNTPVLPVENVNGSLAVLAAKNIKELLRDQHFHEQVCMALSVSMPFMYGKLQQFTNEMAIGGELEKPYQDCQRYFRNWLKKDLIKNPPKEKKLNTQRIIT